MAEQKGFSPITEVKKKKPFQLGQVVEHAYQQPKGKVPENSAWRVIRRHREKNYPLAWQLTSTLPEIPTQEQLPPKMPPEVLAEEIKQRQIDAWHERTDK